MLDAASISLSDHSESNLKLWMFPAMLQMLNFFKICDFSAVKLPDEISTWRELVEFTWELPVIWLVFKLEPD